MTPYEVHFFLWACIFIALGSLPVLGVLLFVLDIKVEKGLLTFIKIVMPIVGIAYFVLGERASPAYPNNDLYLFYSLVLTVFLHFLQIRNPDKAAKVLGTVLMMSHIFTQYWEIPIFIAGHLGILGAKYLGSIDQLYLILVFYLTIRFTNTSINKESLIYLLVPLLLSSTIFCFFPVLTIQSKYIWYFTRGISCLFLGKVFIEGSVL